MKAGEGMKKQMLMIVNPRSGKKRYSDDLLEVTNIFNRHGYNITVMNTTGSGDATRFARELGGKYDTVVCRGGDGTFCETLNGLMALEKRPEIGFIPAGTTNDIAHTLGLPTNPIKAAQLIVSSEALPYDIGLFGERYFTYVASFGAFTACAYKADQKLKNKIGKLAYYLEATKTVKDIREIPMRFVIDGKVIEDEFVFGSISNSFTVGGIIKLSNDQVCLNDGRFEVFIVKNPGTLKNWVDMCTSVLKKDFDERFIHLYQGSHIEVKTLDGSKLPWTLDGEYGGDNGDMTISVKKQAFRMFRPPMLHEMVEAEEPEQIEAE